MTINHTNWQQAPLTLGEVYNRPSPNLLALSEYCVKVVGLPYAGNGFVRRTIRNGTAPSSHYFAAALDTGMYANGSLDTPGLIAEKRAKVLPFIQKLIDTHEQTGIQQIHDYHGDRIWKCNRDKAVFPDGWKKQFGAGSGMGSNWAHYFHIEVCADFWAVVPDYFAILADKPVIPENRPAESPPTQRLGNANGYVLWAKSLLKKRGYTISDGNVFDEGFLRAVKSWQGSNGLVADGIIGPKTWASLALIK